MLGFSLSGGGSGLGCAQGHTAPSAGRLSQGGSGRRRGLPGPWCLLRPLTQARGVRAERRLFPGELWSPDGRRMCPRLPCSPHPVPASLPSSPWFPGLKLRVGRCGKVRSSPQGRIHSPPTVCRPRAPSSWTSPHPDAAAPAPVPWASWVWGSRPAPRRALIQTSRGFCQHVRGGETPSQLGLWCSRIFL